MEAYGSYVHIRKALSEGRISCRQLVEHALNTAEEKSFLNTFIEIYENEALDRADAIDQKIAKGNTGLLAGMIICLKDNIAYKNHFLTTSSNILRNFKPSYNATVTERLLAEDAIILGRTNCDEFGMGSSGENSIHGPVLNPHDTEYVAGGSSGGSAAAVAAGICYAALGTDTGGSVRLPAAFCGVVGFKPTYGSVSRHGIVAFASSFDQVGPITTSIEDTALLYDIIKGPDDFDSSLQPLMEPEYQTKNRKPAKILIPDNIIGNVGGEIKNLLHDAEHKLLECGHDIIHADFSWASSLIPAYHVLTTAEASSNLGRYDGISLGETRGGDTPRDVITKSRTEGFGTEVKRRILLGTFVLSRGNYEEYYEKALKVRQGIREALDELMENVDFLMLPTSPGPAFKVGSKPDIIDLYKQDQYTVLANLAGNPAISIPAGKSKTGLPLGMQFIGKRFKDNELFNFAAEISGAVFPSMPSGKE